MAHYAFINDQNKVVQVITGKDEGGETDWEEYYGNFRGMTCKRTSYNGNYRKNFAGIGFTYDEERDAFIPPKPFPLWVLNEDTCLWESPSEKPEGVGYTWDEENQEWTNEKYLTDKRKSMSLTRKKFMLGIKRYQWNGKSLKNAIKDLLKDMENDHPETVAIIEESLDESTEFKRSDSDLNMMGSLLQMTPEDMDEFFKWAEEEKWREE